MRADLFKDRKCIHIKLNKDVHMAFRTRLFRHDVSMQEVFDEIARQVGEGTKIGNALIETIVSRKLKEALEGKPKRRQNEGFDELDSESLYHLINGK